MSKVSFVLGAKLGSDLTNTFKTVNQKVVGLNSTIKKLKKEQKSLLKVKELDLKLGKAGLELDSLRKKITQTKSALALSPKDTGLKKELQGLERKAQTSQLKIGKFKQELSQTKREMAKAGHSADGYRQKLASLTPAIEKNSRKLDQFQTKIIKQKNAMKSVGAASLRLGAMFAAGYGIKHLASEGMEYKKVLTEIQITAGATDAQMSRVDKAVVRTAIASGQARESVLAGFAGLIRSGASLKRAMASLDPMSVAVTATGSDFLDLATATGSLNDNLKIMPEHLNKAYNIMAVTAKAGKFEFKDMARDFPALTAKLGTALRYRGTEAVASLSSGLQIAFKGAGSSGQAANYMANLLDKMLSPRALKRYKKRGVDLARLSEEWVRKGQDPIIEFVRLTKRLTGGKAISLGGLFQDVQVKNALLPLMENLDEWEALKKEALGSGDVLKIDFQTAIRNDPTKAWSMIGSAFESMRDSIILPVVGEFAQLGVAVTGIIQVFSTAASNVPILGSALSGVVTALKQLAPFLATAAAGFYTYKMALGAVSVAQTSLGLLAATNPLLLVAAGLVTAGYLIYRNWSAISNFIGASWGKIKGFFTSGIRNISETIVNWSGLGLFYRAFLSVLSWFGISLPKKFTEFGKLIVMGLVRGVRSSLTWLKKVMGGLAQTITSKFKNSLGISSPSQVFMGLGHMVGAGASLGIAGQRRSVAAASAGLALAATTAFTPQGSVGLAPPALPSATTKAQHVAKPPALQQTFNITIHQRDGEDAEALARRVADLIKSEDGLRRRRSMHDL